MNSPAIIFARRNLRLAAAGLVLLGVSFGIGVVHTPTQPAHPTANWEGAANWETLH